MNAGVAPAAKRLKSGGRKPHQLELDKGEGGNKPPKQTRFDCERHVCRVGHD